NHDEYHIYAVIRFIVIVIYCLSLVRKSRSLKLRETLNAVIASTEGDMCRQQKESFAALTQHKVSIDAFLCGCTVTCARTKTSLSILQQ
ncbi:hypothetical protein ACU47E_005162, partial [Escherichia coli]